MKLKNKSARPHWIGDTLIAPLATETVGDEWRDAYNKQDLEEVTVRKDEVIVEAGEVEVKPRGRKVKQQDEVTE